MSPLTSDRRGALAHLKEGADELGHRLVPAYRPRETGVSAGWVLAGLAAIGIGAFLICAVAPDIRRYMKIRNM
jgi:hypothetical protein